MEKQVTILGSTGSIGTQSLEVVRAQGFRVFGLAAHSNAALLMRQIEEFHPHCVAVVEDAAADRVASWLDGISPAPVLLRGGEGLVRLAAMRGADIVLNAVVGIAGLPATLAALESGHDVALANKESLVTGGRLVVDAARAHTAKLLPVDSEHSAIFQCLQDAYSARRLQKILLTASGGPFFGKTREELVHVTKEDALRHPNWHMGAKITVDSATLMNKGLEVAEAFHLYGVPGDRIRVLVHPQSIVHSMVELNDGSLLAQMGTADMRMAIAHCLLWPHCAPVGVPPLDLVTAGQLSFHEPDLEAFPCLDLARAALARRGGLCVVMNAANEAAVELFLQGQCAFTDIPRFIAAALEAHAAAAPGHAPFCPPLTTPRDAADPLALEREVHILVERIERLDQHSRALVREMARG